MEEQKEYVDDWFWLKWVKDTVNESLENIDNQLENIRESLKYILGLQLFAGILNLSFNGVDNWAVILLLCLPQPFLLIAYYYSTSKAKNEIAVIDPQDPDDAVLAYKSLMETKIFNLTIAKLLTMVGFMLLFVALICSSLLKIGKVDLFEGRTTFKASLHRDVGGRNQFQIAATGNLPSNDTLKFFIDSYFSNAIRPSDLKSKVKKKKNKMEATKKMDTILSRTFYILNTENGSLQTNFAVSAEAVRHSIRVEWWDDKEDIYKSLRVDLDHNGKSLAKQMVRDTVSNSVIQDQLKFPDLKGVERP